MTSTATRPGTEAGQSWRPEPYQLRAVEFLLSHGAAGLFLDPGLGKTSIGLAALKVLKNEGDAEPALVIAPLRPCYEVWDGRNPEAEPAKWLEFRELRTEVLHGDRKGEALRRKADVYVVNPEGLRWLFTSLRGRWPFGKLLVDESTRFKHSDTESFRLLRDYLGKFRRRWIFTGTPAPNGLLDLFGQIYILDLGNALGRYVTHYRTAYFVPTGYGGYTWVPQHDAEARIHERLRPLVLRMQDRDYLRMRPLVGVDPPAKVTVRLPPAARKVYDDLERHLIADVMGEAVTAANAGVAAMKCRQVANGGLYTDARQGSWRKLHDAKTDAVEEIVEELSGQPAIVAVDFRHDAERLRARLGRGTPYLGGGISAGESRRAIAAWNAGELPVLLANPQSVAHGLNLQAGGGDLVWHSQTFNLEHYWQLIRRLYRRGQRRRVRVKHVVAADTVDEVQIAALRRKDRTQGALLSALREYAHTKSER